MLLARQRPPGLLLMLLLAAAAAAAADADPLPSPLPPPTVLLHLSDIHYSTNVRKYWKIFGDREGDAALFSQALVPRLLPAAVVVTGDITDSKTAHGDGMQQEVEWVAYSRLLSNLTAAGVAETSIHDVPGNHDTFNMPVRGGSNDFFAKYAAEGRRRSSPLQRVYLHPLPAAGAAVEAKAQQGEAEADCPAAWLLGLDPTPEPGLRSPTNFAGLARPAFMAEVHRMLLSLREKQAPGCSPPVIAYCHYPLSTIDSTPHHMPGPPGILLHAAHSAVAMQGLTRLLAEHNVSAVLSGHLHSSFGQRLHRIHATPAGGRMAELETAAWKDDRRFRLVAVDGGALAIADLMFHTRNAPRMPGRSDAGAMEDPAWQDAYAERGWAVTALDPTATVIDHIALVTSPPDARYSPLGAPAAAAAEQQGSSQDGAVRAVVFALQAEGAAQPEQLQVELAGFLPSGIQLFSKPMQLQQQDGSGSSSSSGSGSTGGGLLFAAVGDTTVSCVGAAGDPAATCRPPAQHVLIQVSVQQGTNGLASRSPQQPAVLRCTPLTASHQRCWVSAAADGSESLPLKPSLLEWMGLAFNWPAMVHRLFLSLWAFQVGVMLLAPRLLRNRVLPHIAANPRLQCCPPRQLLPSTPGGAAVGSSVAGAALEAVCSATAFITWPVAALFVCANVTEVWATLLAYSGYLLVGPWLAYTALSGYQPALMFHFGVLGRLSLGGSGSPADADWHFIGTPDTMFVSLVHYVVCILPATLWVACVVARRMQPHQRMGWTAARSSSSESSSSSNDGKRCMEGGGAGSTLSLLSVRRSSSSISGRTSESGSGSSSGRWSFSGYQIAAFVSLALFNWAGVYHKAAALMGPHALLLSPGLFWTLPLALLVVVCWGGPRRRRGQASKGE